MALYDFASRRAEAQNKFAAEQLAAEQGRFAGQQRFARNRQDLTRGFQEAFPRFTAQWARRLGSGVQSGVFGQGLARNVGGYTQRMTDIGADEARMMGEFTAGEVMRRAALENLLRAIGEEEKLYGLGNKR